MNMFATQNNTRIDSFDLSYSKEILYSRLSAGLSIKLFFITSIT